MLLFRSEEHVNRWCTLWNMPQGGLMSPEQGWRLADEWYRDRLKFDWERKTLQEAQALFSRLGLTSSFWSLQ